MSKLGRLIVSLTFSRLVRGARPIGSSAIRAVLFALADHADEQGRCWPSEGLLASETELSVRSVRRGIAALAERGWIAVERKKFGQLRRGNLYLMSKTRLVGHQRTQDKVSAAEAPTQGSVAPVENAAEDTLSPVQRTLTTITEDTVAPVIEPSRTVIRTINKNISKASPSHPVGAAQGDSLIYEAYPRREGKGAAMKAIAKAMVRLTSGKDDSYPPMTKVEAQRLLYAMTSAYAQSPAGNNPDRSLIPHPATWFNQSRYLDDQTNWRNTGGDNGTYKPHLNRWDALRAEIEAEDDNEEPIDGAVEPTGNTARDEIMGRLQGTLRPSGLRLGTHEDAAEPRVVDAQIEAGGRR